MAIKHEITPGRIAATVLAVAGAAGYVAVNNQVHDHAKANLDPKAARVVAAANKTMGDITQLSTLKLRANKGEFSIVSEEMETETPYPVVSIKGTSSTGRQLPYAFHLARHTTPQTRKLIFRSGNKMTLEQARARAKVTGDDVNDLVDNVVVVDGTVVDDTTYATTTAQFKRYKTLADLVTKGEQESIEPVKADINADLQANAQATAQLADAVEAENDNFITASDVVNDASKKGSVAEEALTYTLRGKGLIPPK